MSNFLKTGRKIVAIGRNYADHAKELGNAIPKEPFFFLKPTSSYLSPGQGPVELPRGTIVHHEVELGVVIGKNGRDIPLEKAESYIAGYTLAIDMTARNVQDAVKAKGLPWSTAKGFDTFTPIGKFIPKDLVGNSANVGLHFSIDGKLKQSGLTSDMIFDIPQLIAFVSGIMRLEASGGIACPISGLQRKADGIHQEGDVVLTGTPKGVGPIKHGETFQASLTYPGVEGEKLDEIEFECRDREGGYEFQGK
ncbi:acylpyruvate hydrolase, partial [Tremellales sp. Uapishka_1]